MDDDTLDICLVANRRFPIREPFAGGLESMTWHLARELVRRGHRVTVFAAPGSDPALGVDDLTVPALVPDFDGRLDLHPPVTVREREDRAYRDLMGSLARDGSRYDVLHNNSLHPIPLELAATVPVPMMTTLHTPPLAVLEAAARRAGPTSTFAAVSGFTARAWARSVPSVCVPNGIDVTRWPFGPGGDQAVWFGRIVPEKAPHEAIDAARLAGIGLVLAGPVMDRDYHDAQIRPRLGGDVTHVGHLHQHELALLVATGTVAVSTPAWDEPYGLVAAEALSCGTPVAAYARGALPEVVGDECGRFAAPGDVAGLGAAIRAAASLDRSAARRRAVESLSLTRMVDLYEAHYRTMTGSVAA